MRGAIGFVVLGVGLSFGASCASAQNIDLAYQNERSQPNFMQIYGNTQAPAGFVRFCELNPSSCQTKGSESRVDLSPDHVGELDAVNRYVNKLIIPASDSELYGVREYWALPTNRGDCEDYALLKQKLLAERGWPTGALLLTVVRDDNGDGHAILTVRTNEGDIILDNKVDEIRMWNTTAYTYIMRQSYLNPKVWISLDSGDAKAPMSLAGTQNLKE